ncbi:Ankyrin repeat domain-containing protein 44 [Xylographa soralifera]|nr:Ankyrin repeat domain-containing protein 44 [Xylographa soralifera]
MDPITILGGVATALKLVKSVCEIIQWMQRVNDSLKNSSRILKMIYLECNIYGDSIKSIGEWLKENQSMKGLQKQLRTTHNAITLVKVSMANLQRDLETIGSGQEKLTIKSFKNCIKVRHQWFEQTMKIHLTELRCHSQTLQLTLQVIQLTKPSELPLAQAQKAPEKLEQKTRSLEKRLLLRHFLTKALEIRRAEIAAEEERRNQAMKEFIRLTPVSPPIQPSIHSEGQPQTSSVLTVVEQARQKAVAEQENKVEDLLSNDMDDLIDFSNEFLTLPTQGPAISIPTLQDLDGLRGLLMSQQTVPNTTVGAKSDIQDEHAVFDDSPERKHLQSPRLACEPQVPDLNIPEVDGQRQSDAKTFKPVSSESSQIGSQFSVPNPRMANIDTQSILSGHDFDMSPTTTATPSIFSHASTLSSASGSSWHGITEAELRERDSKTQTLPNQSSPPSKPVRRKAVRSCSSESLEQGGLSSPHMALYPVSPPTIHEDSEFIPSAMSRASTGEKLAPIALEVSLRSKSEDAIHQLDFTTEPSLQDINKPDGEGFPWIVQAGRDGDETQMKRLIISGANLEAVHATTKRTALCEASLRGHSNVVDLLIHEGCLTNQADAESYTALHHACHKGHLAIVKSLIAANADIEASGPQSKTPLHLAAQVPHRNVVMLLLQRNANVNTRDEHYQTPLHISAAQGNVEMCSFLLENGAQLDNRDFKSKTALQLACEAGHYDTAEAMLQRSSLRTTDLTFLTAFFAAVEYGNVRIAESFLARELDLQKLNKNDIYKPATLAAKSGSSAMLELMIRQNCSIKAKDDNDWNALHFATQHGHWQLIEPLVANDVPVKAATRMKDTPLILAVKGGHFTATEILLRSKGISVTVEDGQAEQPIHHATRAGSFEIFNLLISNGAKIAVENAFGWHPIHIAVAYGHTTLVNRLIEQSVKIEEKLGSPTVKKDQTHRMIEDGYLAEARWPYPGSRPLHLACEYGHYQIASNLISRGAKLEASCSEGWRPLHHAAFNGSSDLVDLLINANCYPWAETEEGKTPQALQFRTAGSPISQEEKDKVRMLLQAAMDRTTKQPETKGFKVGLKKGRTVEEKHKLIRAATFSMEMAAKSPKQSTQTHRPHHTQPPMPHSNTFPSALPSIHHPAQPSQSLLVERPVSSGSNRPATTTSESNLETAIKIASPTASLISLPSTSLSESNVEKPPSINVMALGPATTVALQHSMGPVQGLPDLPLNLMKNKFKLKRASTFGVGISKQSIEKVSSGLGSSKQGLEKMSSYSLDVSKQGIEKMSSGLGSSKQGIEKMSSYSLDVSKQGYKKMSSYGQNMSKQGLEKMKKINYGQNMSKQGMEKMKKISIRRDKKLTKQDTDGDNSGKDRVLELAFASTKDSNSTTPNTPGPSQSSGGFQNFGQNAGDDQGATGDTASMNPQSDEDLPYNSDGAESIGAFSMGGFDTYDAGGDDGGGFGGGDFGDDGC